MRKLACLLFLVVALSACRNEKPLISNSDRLNDIERMLKVQQELTANSLEPIWTVLDHPASKNEEQALKFIFAYMPLSDLADCLPEFIKANIKQSLLARKEMPWGNNIPEEEFLHFVLPMRVNNENLDSFRMTYYPEIKARVKGLTMRQAALEINHWCHEKVNYRGTDSRTSAPMSTIKKTFGRCGEESTFTVSAMRAAGIPSRQVYTPRWAHTDDNHAWVEVWIDGKWHYMGACEPDTDLDRGWFSEPSQRTMMVHTRTYGRYFGSEEVLDAEDRFSELNLTANYARTKKVTILVSDNEGKAATGAKVEFKLYNYAEFYPLASIVTDRNGAAQLTTGLGDLLVWASKEGKFAYDKLSANIDTLRLVLNKTSEVNKTINYDLVPPKAFKPVLAADEKDKEINDRRLAVEDSIRNHYMSTFKDSAWIRSFAKNHKMAEDTLLRVLRLSYGNWKEMVDYIENNQASARKLLFPLTYGISDKDLSDTRAAVLTDHLVQALATAKPEEVNSGFYEKYVLAPRVDLELLSPWRSFLWKHLGAEMIADTRQDINVLTNWIRTNIRIDRDANKHSRAPLTPIGVYNLRVADPLSRDIFFVAACRTFGIPARLNPETHIPEYNKSGRWYRAGFEAVAVQPEMGKLSLKDRNNSLSPQYTLHFTIASIQDGVCKTLDFDEGKKLTDFPDPIMLETGHYILVTGNRLTDGSVLSSVTFFEITKENPATIDVTLRKEGTTVKLVGQLEPMKIHLTGLSDNRQLTLSELMGKSSSIIVLLDPDSEPSKHILNDLAPYIDQFNQWNGRFIFVNISEKTAKSAIFQTYKLPSKIVFAADTTNELRKGMTNLTGIDSKDNLPVVVFCQSSGEVLMVSSGYKIGVGEQLLRLIKRVEESCVPAGQARCAVP
jgi:transglutaminase-like putative cysteine protease